MPVVVNKSDIAELQFALAGIRGATKRVLTRTINRTMTQTRNFAQKEIRKDLNLPAKRVKKDFKIIKAYAGYPKGRIQATGKPVSLASYGARQTNKGLSVIIRRSKGRKIWRHGFFAKVKGRKQPFWRAVEPPKRAKYRPKWKRRYPKFLYPYRPFFGPLERLTGPRVEDEFIKKEVMEPTLKFAGDKFKDQLNKEMNYEIGRFK